MVFLYIYIKLLQILYFLHEVMVKYNTYLYPGYWDKNENKNEKNETDKINTIEPKKEEKYEDKYLNVIRQLNKEWKFTTEEQEEIDNLKQSIYNKYEKEFLDDINNITFQIDNLNKDIDEDTDIERGLIIQKKYGDVEGEFRYQYLSLEERNYYRNEYKEELIDYLNKLKVDSDKTTLEQNSYNKAREVIINRRLDNIKNSYIMEHTPQGNVLMMYDNNKSSFKYYSDKSVPYRYLEVVARKYVKTFNCRPIFVDMEEELKLFEEKWTKEYELKKQKELEKAKAEETKQSQVKKNVFAKFKSYNKDVGGKIAMAPPPKNSIPKTVSETKEDEKILLKERANRYTYEGKMCNFNFLQKVERKVFDKKLALSFADFKKMKTNN